MMLMTVRSSGNILRLILSLLILIGVSGSMFSQTQISGNIKNIRGANKYPHTSVTAIPGANKMTVSDPAGLIVGDTVLVIQMQGVEIYTTPGFYGNWAAQFGQPGLWEFIIISGVSGNDITFSNNLKVAYDIKGNIQIVNVPSFNSATVAGLSDLTCDPWDPVTKSGGVMALIVGNTLKLQRNIDVTGLGFKGGAADFGDGICQKTDGSYQLESYADSYANAGWKGEGIAIHNSAGGLLLPSNAKGKGANFTGGGGGNGSYSGGGGGSHRGSGGNGGSERNTCFPTFGGGLGGFIGELNPDLLNRILLGGGGGASTKSNPNGITGPGGNGGGVVIIIANTIIGDGGNILSKGGKGSDGGGTGPSGAAGGGAGGTIALSVLNYSGSLDVNVEGGKGGNNPTPRLYGEGGGGGGGLIWLTIDNAVVKPFMNGGTKGNCDNPTANDGGTGEKRVGFNPNLNGFLFNSIRSSVTELQVDTSCSNMIPPKLLGTLPVGGVAPYTVTWEESTDAAFTTPVIVATGTNLWDYTPQLKDTLKRSGPIFFRRKITDSSIPFPLLDVSLAVEILIQPSIQRNYVGPPDTICFAQDPPPLGPMASLVGGNNIYTYKWMVSTNNTIFNSPANNTNPGYTPPPALTLDSWYRRTVTSGRCIDSTGIVKIKVLTNIGGNNITSAAVQEICNGMNFTPVTANVAPALTGGDLTYRYKWVSSATSWNAAPDTYTNANYNPVAGSFPLGTPVSLRRVVFSGTHDVCKDTSTIATAVKLTRWPVITNNSVVSDQTIGYDSIPQLLIASPGPGITGGNGSYLYTWQKDTLSWANAPGTFNQSAYQSPKLKVTTSFRRFVASSACTSISNTITITVHTKITNTIALANAAKDSIATGTGPGQLTGSVPTGGSGVPGDYSYKWYMSSTGVFVPGDLIAGATLKDYDPGILTAVGSISTYYFRRDVSSPIVSPTSTYKSNIIKIVVLPVLQNYNILGSLPKCSGFRPDWLKGTTPPVSGGDGKYKYTWQDSTSLHNFTDIPGFIKCDSINYKPPVLTSGAAYRRIVYSGKNYTLLNATSIIVRVIVYPLPTAAITTVTDTSICGGTAAKVMISLTGATKFRVTMKENGTNLSEVPNIAGPNYTFSIIKTPAAASEIYNYAISKVIDQNTCQTTTFPAQSRKVTVYKQPVADAGADIPQVCGANIFLNAKAAAGTGTWSWKKLSTTTGPGNAWFNNGNDARAKVKVDSLTTAWENKNSYRFYWTDVNSICSSRDSVNITFDKPVPPVVFNPAAKWTNNIDRIDTLPTIATPVGTGIWDPVSKVRDGNIAYNLTLGENIFTYTVTNDACTSPGQYIIEVIEVRIPQGFSPNGDGSNDLFEIMGLDLDANDVTLKIINSAGSEVFYTDNISWELWDGTKKGADLPEGTYYYLLTIISKRDNTVRMDEKGFLILKRKSYQ